MNADPGADPGSWCCAPMGINVADQCENREHAYGSCPDQVIVVGRYGWLGLPIPGEAGGGAIEIRHCPWCGTRLQAARLRRG